MFDHTKNYVGTMEKVYTFTLFLMNAVTLTLGLLYLSIGSQSTFWNVYGVILLLSLFGNILLAAIEKVKNLICNLYLLLSTISMPAIFIINTVVSINPANYDSQSTISAILILSLSILGGAIAAEKLINEKTDNDITYNDKANIDKANIDKANIDKANIDKVNIDKANIDKTDIDKTDKFNTKQLSNDKPGNDSIHLNASGVNIKNSLFQVFYNIAVIVLSAALYLGLFLSINLLRVSKFGLLEMFLSQYALFYSLMFLSIGVLIIRLMDRKKYVLYYSIVLTATIFIVTVLLLPFLSVPTLLHDAEKEFTKVFKTQVMSVSKETMDYFRKQPFSLPEYFFGTRSKNFNLQENILFYEGTRGADSGLNLYFDVYTPASDGKKLPGGNSVLIRIHGGSWTSGDKGVYNFAQMNKYFAAQGYLVFDIEYGLNDSIDWFDLTKTRDSMKGNYNIDDMVRHIGIFMKYLKENNDLYNADLNSVFLSGGSAGGQLALASALSIDGKKNFGIINSDVTIKGIIPLYPANGLPKELHIGGRETLVEPSALVKEDSPPCLIYQGSHDGLVNVSIAENLQKTYFDCGNDKCAIILMPFGGHSSDLYFSGYYNQVFIYYMERFMYRYR
ncbi:MAG: hypothetical protein K0S76_2913 [Herbinix sp.]|nr:hypothetical protein [Herbinix sp.]